MRLYRNQAGIYRSALLDAIPWIEYGFGTAQTNPTAESKQLKQIHSAHVVSVADWRPGCEGDALISNQPGVWISVKTADCVPLLLADTAQHVVAAVHAGWRGAKDRIAQRTVERMNREYGTRPSDIVAVIGPAIRLCCFEVGPEVAAEFQGLFPERGDLDTKTKVDLAEANRRVLAAAGVPEPAISTLAPCTFCHGREFHSWRRDRQTGGRMISAISVARSQTRG